jgi:hypothetical protein
MSTAIFGISNSGLNLVVTLLVLMVIVVWLALIVYTYLDARRRIEDPFLVACATVGSFFPYIGTAVYAIVRPPEFLEDAHERELEIKAAELRVRQLTEASCPNCEYPIEKSFLRCPSCERRLKDPCGSCGKPVDPRWSLCPYCETPLARHERERDRERERPTRRRESKAPPREKRQAPERQPPPRQQAPPPDAERPVPPPQSKRPQRSPKREPDPDPRQA